MAGKRKRVASVDRQRDSPARTVSHRPARRTEPTKESITWECEGVSTIGDTGKDSKTITVKGLEWYVRVRTETSARTQRETQFSVYLYCLEKNHLDVWYADAKVEVTIINRRDVAKNKTDRFSYRYTHRSNNSGYSSFIKMSDLLAPAQGFISNDKVLLEVSVSVLRVHGLPSAPTPLHNFAAPMEHISNGTLVVDGKKLFISKQILAINSPVFEALFFRGFKESNQEEIELEEVKYDEFVELLHVIYTADKEINPENCLYLLNLADRFQVKSVLKRVEHFLCTCYEHPDYPLASRLRLAEEYDLYEAQHAILLKLTKPSEIKTLKNQRDYVPLSDTMKLAISNIELKFMAKE